MSAPHSAETLVPDPEAIARHAIVTERGQGVYTIAEANRRPGAGFMAVQMEAVVETVPVVTEVRPALAKHRLPLAEKIAALFDNFIHPHPNAT